MIGHTKTGIMAQDKDKDVNKCVTPTNFFSFQYAISFKFVFSCISFDAIYLCRLHIVFASLQKKIKLL